MQFHHNGFHDGNPEVFAAAEGRETPQGELPEELDVLIIGSGPAGLTLAAQLASYPEIRTRIVERKSGPMLRGQADGVSCRSMEMFKAFDFADKVMKEGYWVNEATFWGPSSDDPARITRIGRVQDVADDLSEMPHIILNQARIHDMYLDYMQNSASKLTVDYHTELEDLSISSEEEDYPVTVTLKQTTPDAPLKSVTVKAKYVIGCDGARSRVRSAIGGELKGDFEGQAWGVMDILANTDFPDFRFKSIIKSAAHGNILLIPREGGFMVRFYVELDKIGERGASRDISLDRLISAAKAILHPYSLDVKDVAWWSVYEVGHSVTDKFDDIPESDIRKRLPHVFIAGDACHTHSAKAGQGMNVSMGDTFNLGWKLISVLKGKCHPDLLHSYSEERRAVAQDLIDFDHTWARIMSKPTTAQEINSSDAPLVQQHFQAGGRFTAGLSVTYQPSVLTGKAEWQHLATGLEIGSRFHSAPAIRLADAKCVQINDVIKADTRWHIFAFAGAGDPLAENSRLVQLCAFLEKHSSSPIRKYTPEKESLDSVINFCAVLQQGHDKLDFNTLPALLRPLVGTYRITDYEKAFCADQKGDRDIFSMRGINRENGCMVIVRPDQYISHILPLDAYEDLRVFFDGFMLKP